MKNGREQAGGRLAVYVTSHGFGHLNRTAAVLNQVPTDVPVTIRSNSNLFEHWRERLKRPAEFEHYVCDVGAVNPPGDSNATDAGGDDRTRHAISQARRWPRSMTRRGDYATRKRPPCFVTLRPSPWSRPAERAFPAFS